MKTNKAASLALITCSLLGMPGHASATLHARGEYMVYDDASDLTWLLNPTYGRAGAFDDGHSPNDGLMTYASAVSWVDQLSVINTDTGSSIGGWRLPTPIDSTAWGSSELALLVYHSLGNTVGGIPDFGPFVPPPSGLASPIPFAWLGAEYELPPGIENANSVLTVEGWLVREPSQPWPPALVWGYLLNENFTGPAIPTSEGYAWAVHVGDVSTVPEPAVYVSMLVGFALISITALSKKRSRSTP